MGLWDILTGRVSHWNKIKDQCHQLFVPRLKAFPCDDESARRFRDYIFAFYLGCLMALTDFLFKDQYPGKRFRNRVSSMTAHGLLNIICTFHLRNVVVMATAEPLTEVARFRDAVTMKTIVEVYGGDDTQASKWISLWGDTDVVILNKELYQTIAN